MLRRTVQCFEFSPRVLQTFSPADALPFSGIVTDLSQVLSRHKKNHLLLRSEPQSGKTSLLTYLEQSCTVFADGGAQGKQHDAGRLRPVDVAKSREAARRLGLGDYVVRCFGGDDPEHWLSWARAINKGPVDVAQSTLLFIDEGHLMFGDARFGEFFKSAFKGRAVFVGTSSSSTTLTAPTPLYLKQFYMQPAFAERQALVDWFDNNLVEEFEKRTMKGKDGTKDDVLNKRTTLSPKQRTAMKTWTKYVAEAAVHVCGCRVGISNYVGDRLVANDKLMDSIAKQIGSGETRIDNVTALLLNLSLIKALGETRLMCGDNGPWNDDQSVLVAAAMLEGTLRDTLFNPSIQTHRKLLSSSGLRVANPSTQQAGRYEATPNSPALLEIDNATFTPVSPMGFAEFLSPGTFKWYVPPYNMACMMPIYVEPPKTGLDLVLRCLPYMNVVALLRGEAASKKLQVKSDKKHEVKFVKGSAFPREVGGFQDQFRAAIKHVFGPQSLSTERQPQAGGNVDVIACVNGQELAVEMLVENQKAALVGQVKKHHERWADNYYHANYVRRKDHGVTVAFVSEFPEITNNLVNDVPLLFVRFSHGAFSWLCRLWWKRHPQPGHEVQPLDFMLDIDGVAMQLSGNGKGIEPAQRIAASTFEIQEFRKSLLKSTPRTFDYVVDGGKHCVVTVSHPWTAALLLKELNISSSEYDVYAPNRFGHHELVSPGSRLPMTTSSCFLKIKKLRAKKRKVKTKVLRAKRQAKTVIRSRQYGWDR